MVCEEVGAGLLGKEPALLNFRNTYPRKLVPAEHRVVELGLSGYPASVGTVLFTQVGLH